SLAALGFVCPDEGSMARRSAQRLLAFLACWVLCLVYTGCRTALPAPGRTPTDMPTELNKVAHPEYTLAPPDILLIDAVTLIPRPPYRIAPLDALLIRATRPVEKEGGKEDGGALIPGQPIDGIYRVEADGTVNLGFTYGSVQLRGLTIREAR